MFCFQVSLCKDNLVRPEQKLLQQEALAVSASETAIHPSPLRDFFAIPQGAFFNGMHSSSLGVSSFGGSHSSPVESILCFGFLCFASPLSLVSRFGSPFALLFVCALFVFVVLVDLHLSVLVYECLRGFMS